MSHNNINQSLVAYGIPVASSDGLSIGGVTLNDGQTLIGSTANAPQAATLTAGTNVTITNGSNSITVAASGTGGFAVTKVKVTYLTSSVLYFLDPKMVAVRIDAVGAGGSVPGLATLAVVPGSLDFSYNCFGCGADGGTYARVFATKGIGTALQVQVGEANPDAVGIFRVPDNLGALVSPPPSNLASNYPGGDTVIEFLGSGGVVATLTCPGGAGARLTSNSPTQPAGASTTLPTPSFRWPRSLFPSLATAGSQPVKMVVAGASVQGQPGVAVRADALQQGTRITGAGGGSYFSKGGATGEAQTGNALGTPSDQVPYGAGNRAIGRPSTTQPDFGQQAPEGGAVLIYEYISD